MDPTPPQKKKLFFVGSSQKDLRDFPEEVKDEVGVTLLKVQYGATPINVKPLRGFRGASVLEVVEDYDTNTYRAVYTVQFAGVVYVLHAFQKKAKRGIATPQQDMDLVKQRLLLAQAHYQDWKREQEGG